MTRRSGPAALAALALAATVGCGGGGEEPTPRATEPRGAGRAVSIRVLKSRDNSTALVVPVTIAGRGPFPFIVDTGASQSLLEPELVRRLRIPVVSGSPDVTGIGGAAAARYVEVREWRAGGVRLPRQRVFTLGRSSRNGTAGLLGSDVLSSFGRVTVDFRRQEILLGPRE